MKTLTKFAIGATTAVSLLGTSAVAFAQSGSSTSGASTRPIPTQACVQALAAAGASRLSTFDADTAARKTLMQSHQAAISAAGAIADDTARQAALKKAHEDFRTAMKTAMEAKKTTNQTTMDAVKAACGDMGIKGFHGGMGMKMNMGMKMRGGRHGGAGF